MCVYVFGFVRLVCAVMQWWKPLKRKKVSWCIHVSVYIYVKGPFTTYHLSAPVHLLTWTQTPSSAQKYSGTLRHRHQHHPAPPNVGTRHSPLPLCTVLSQLNYLPVHFSPLPRSLVLTYFVICSIPLAILPTTTVPLFFHLHGLAPRTETLGRHHLRRLFPHPWPQ